MCLNPPPLREYKPWPGFLAGVTVVALWFCLLLFGVFAVGG